MIYAIESYFSILTAVAIVWAVLLVPVALFLLIDEGWQHLLAGVSQLRHAEPPAKPAVAPVRH